MMFVSIVNVKPGDKFRFLSISGDVITRRVLNVADADPEYAMSWKDRAYLIKLMDGTPLFYNPESLVIWNDRVLWPDEPAWEVVYPPAHFAEMGSE